ncbi:MAG: hypothetical protein J6Y47_09390 [Bacteroidales bacterium]|nr:hypothetical protein [Bacteroidales bacterium]
MKPYKILVFILLTFSALALLGMVFPKNGVNIGLCTLTFPTPGAIISDNKVEEMDIESNLEALNEQATMSHSATATDSLAFYRNYVRNNAARIYFPNNDYTYFDKLFAILESAHKSDKAVHIVHYGDSQIEMDRISSMFRHRIQEQFGGKGAGMVPPIQTIPSFTVRQNYAGNLSRYVVYGDTSQPRASHRRYGILANMAQLSGEASITVGASTGSRTFSETQKFSRIVLLIGNNADHFSAVCGGQQRSIAVANRGVSRLTWTLPQAVSQTTIHLNGTAEIYAVSMEDPSGVNIDNVPMRGCSGTIFTRMDSLIFAQCNANMNVQLIIMQYGGNMMPQINSQKAIDNYMERIAKQIQYIHHCNPKAKILFIGPSDMSKRIDGVMQTYTYLPAMNEALKATVLKNDAAYWDMYNVMGGKNSMVSWVKHSPAWAGGDYVHFTEAGALKIATTLSDAFLLHYHFYVMRKRFPDILMERLMKSNQ